MQMGIAAEELLEEIRMAAGTTQLDSFVPESGGLTGQGPPTIALEDDSKPLPDSESDEEDLLAKADEFPELPKAVEGQEMVFSDGSEEEGDSEEVLKDMISKTSFAVSRDETRPVLNGVFWEVGKGQMTMVATDASLGARVR